MDKIREISYKINNLNSVKEPVLKAFEEDFSNVKGVLGVKFDFDNSKITYAIDEWTSDYDVLCKLNEICEDKGLDLSFDDDESENEEEIDNQEKSEDDKTQEIEESEEDLSKIQEGDEFDEKEEKVKGKLSKADFIEKAIIFGLALLVTLVGVFVNGAIKPWILMIAFTLASYETLYDVVVKIAVKEYFLDEVLTFAGALLFMYLGYTELSATIMILYSGISFIKVLSTHNNALKLEKLKLEEESSEDENLKQELAKKIEYFESKDKICDLKSLKLYSNKLKFSIAFIVLAVLTVFVPPLFSIKTYWATLSDKWLYLGATVLTLSSLGEYFFSCFSCAKISLFTANENGVQINDYDKFISFAKINKLSFEIDGVLLNENGNVKNDLDGAIKELKYDLNVTSEILSSQKSDKVSQVKKGYEFNGAIAGASDKYKVEHVEKTNSIYVSNGDFDKDVLSKTKKAIAFNSLGDVTVLDGQVKRVPFIIKLSKRTDKILNFNKYFTLIFKVLFVLISLVLTIFTSFKYGYVLYGLDAFIRIIVLLNSERNSQEVV